VNEPTETSLDGFHGSNTKVIQAVSSAAGCVIREFSVKYTPPKGWVAYQTS
jgi:hypothetical protein